MLSIAKLSLELKIGAQTIITYLHSIGIKNLRLNTRLSENTILKVKEYFSAKPNSLLTEAPYQVLLTENIFTESVQKVTYKGEKTINSYFTDEQAKVLCSKMSVGKIRYYSNLFLPKANLKNKSSILHQGLDWDLLKYQIHFIVAKALDFYGGKILTFIFKLRQLPLYNLNTEVLSANKKWYKNEEICFPTFQLSKSEENNDYYIRFTKMYEKKKPDHPILYITDKKRRSIATFSKNGELITKFKEQFPSLLMFHEIVDGKITLYSGYDNGYCDICGLELTNALSISYGRGPECRDKYPV